MDPADAEYLKGTVGDALAEGLSRITKAQPNDAVDFLGTFLLKYAQNEVDKARRKAEKDKRNAALREQRVAARAEKKRIQAEQKAAEAAEEALESLQNKIEECNDVDEIVQEVLDKIKEISGAASVYIGQRRQSDTSDPDYTPTPEEEEFGSDFIRYISTTAGDEWMLEQILKQSQGVTFGCWDMPAEAPPQELMEGESPRPPELQPKHITNVLRVSKMKFFKGIPSLGAYLAVPFVYTACLSDAALAKAMEFGLDDEDAEASIPKTSQEMCLCMDTCVRNRPGEFAEEAIAKCTEFARLLGECYGRTDMTRLRVALDMQKTFAMKNNRLKQKAAQSLAGAIEKGQAKLTDEEEAGVSIEQKLELARNRVLFSLGREWLAEIKANVLQMQKFHVQPPAVPLKVLRQVFYLLGYDKSALCDLNTVSWFKMRKLFNEDFLARINALETEPLQPQETPKYRLYESIRAGLEGIEEEAMNDFSVAVGALLRFAKAALDLAQWASALRDFEAEMEAERLEKLKEQEEAAAAAAEEEEDEA